MFIFIDFQKCRYYNVDTKREIIPEREMKKMIKKFSCKVDKWSTEMEFEISIEEDVVRYTTNNRVPPSECLFAFQRDGHITIQQQLFSNDVRQIESAQFFQQMRSKPARKHTHEELAEMRSEFGKGAVVINVITGRRIKL